MTVKGLEPEIQRLIAQHKTELKKIKSIHEAELLESDERASQRYVRQIEELRDQLASEKEAACSRERQLAKESYVLSFSCPMTDANGEHSWLVSVVLADHGVTGGGGGIAFLEW